MGLVQQLNKVVLPVLFTTSIAATGCRAPLSPELKYAGQARSKISHELPKNQYRPQIKFINEEARAFAEEYLGLSKENPHHRIFRNSPPKTYCQLHITKKGVLPRGFSNGFEITEDYEFREEIPSHAIILSFADSLEDEEEHYREDHDVLRVCVSDFNSPNSSSDLTPEFFQRSKVEQVQVFLEEICHYTLNERVRFEIPLELKEALCGVMSYAGTVDFFKKAGSPEKHQEAVQSFKDRKQWAHSVNYYHKTLNDIYNLELNQNWNETWIEPARQKLFAEAKESLGLEEVNNAVLWHESIYAEHFPAINGIYQDLGRDTRKTFEAVTTALIGQGIPLPSLAKEKKKTPVVVKKKEKKEKRKRRNYPTIRKSPLHRIYPRFPGTPLKDLGLEGID